MDKENCFRSSGESADLPLESQHTNALSQQTHQPRRAKLENRPICHCEVNKRMHTPNKRINRGGPNLVLNAQELLELAAYMSHQEATQ
jgi:hypothetical protein